MKMSVKEYRRLKDYRLKPTTKITISYCVSGQPKSEIKHTPT